MVGIEDVLNPDDIAIYRALAGGVTTANILHGSANPIGGKCQVIKMRWGKDAQEMIFEGAMPGIKFALGENPKRAGNPTGRLRRLPRSALSGHAHGRGGCHSARPSPRRSAYQQAWDDYNAKVARDEQRHPAAPRSEAGAAGGSAGRQALCACALLPRG